jgi:mannose-6-phosphate isomerase-like protein (cupin superfamily)
VLSACYLNLRTPQHGLKLNHPDFGQRERSLTTEYAGLFQPETLQPFYTEERCEIVEYLNTPLCADASVAECRVAPGVTTQLHQLTVAERYVVQQGQGLMELNGEVGFHVQAGDCVLIPAECPQRIKNTGVEPLVFLCVCTPRFLPHHYYALETEQAPSKDIVAP